MENLVTQVGVNGIFAMLLLNMVLGFLSKRKNGSGMKQELHEVRMIEKTDSIARAVETNTAVLNRLLPILERLEKKV